MARFSGRFRSYVAQFLWALADRDRKRTRMATAPCLQTINIYGYRWTGMLASGGEKRRWQTGGKDEGPSFTTLLALAVGVRKQGMTNASGDESPEAGVFLMNPDFLSQGMAERKLVLRRRREALGSPGFDARRVETVIGAIPL